MATFIKATVYARKIPVDAIIDLVRGAVREATGTFPRSIAALGNGSYEFEMEPHADRFPNRRMSMFTRTPDPHDPEEIARVEGADPRFFGHKGYALSFMMGSFGEAREILTQVAATLHVLGPAILSDDLVDEPYELLPDGHDLEGVFALHKESVYRAEQIAASLESGGIEEASDILEKIRAKADDLSIEERTRRRGFEDLILASGDNELSI